MSIPTFTQGYPPDTFSLGQTKKVIRDNLDGTFLTLAVDHINNNGLPGPNPAGYHKVIHIVPQGSNPGAVAGYGQLFSKTVNSYTTDQALFWETGAGLVQQLTTNLVPLAAANGYSFFPGGIIVQWGSVSASSAGVPVVFPTAFVATPYGVQISYNSAGDVTGFTANAQSITNAGFSAVSKGGSNRTVFWFAIGK